MNIALITVLSFQLQILDRCVIQGFFPAASHVVFLESETTTIPAQIVAVDQDGTVVHLSVGPDGCRQQATLGTEVTRSGDLSVLSWIDQGEVVVEAQRVTTQSGVLHFIVTYAIMPGTLKWERTYYSLSSYVCYLYVFRQQGQQTQRLLKEDKGARLVSFDLVDVDGDGWRDGVIRTRTRPQGDDLSVVQVDGGNGQVRQLHVPEGCDEWWNRGGAVVLGRQVNRPSEDSTIITEHEEYQWDSENADFVRTHKYIRRCTYSKPE